MKQRRVNAIEQKLDKLDKAFLYSETIDVKTDGRSPQIPTYGRQRDKLREELTFAKIDHPAEAVDLRGVSQGPAVRDVKRGQVPQTRPTDLPS